MYIFVNAATKEKSIILYDSNQIVDMIAWTETGKESEHVLPGLMKILEKNAQKFEDISSITVVHGPGAFTGLRVVVSVINTIVFVHPHIQLYALSVGELFASLDDQQHEMYVFQIYPADVFVFHKNGSFHQRVDEAAFQSEYTQSTSLAGELLIETDCAPITKAQDLTVSQLHDARSNATLTNGILVPFYAKEPNITTRKKS